MRIGLLLSLVALAVPAAVSATVVETTRSALSIGPVGAVRPHMVLQGAAGATDAARQGPASYRDVYPGIGVEYYFRDGEFEYDFHVSPGADPSIIRLTFPAARRASIDSNGDLLVESAHATVRHRHPFSYQTTAAGLIEIPSAFRIVDRAVTFQLGAYDRSRPLVIDPRVVYATQVIPPNLQALGKDGAVLLGGTPYGTAVTDAVVQKLDPQGNIQFTLRLNSPQTVAGIAVDSAGSVYFNGPVNSASPPRLVNPAKTAATANYLAKSLPDGSGFAMVTYYDGVTGPMAIAADGNIFIGGFRPGAVENAVTKIAPTGAVLWTYGLPRPSVQMQQVVLAGESVFVAGVLYESTVARVARVSAGADPGQSAYVKSWNLPYDGPATAFLEPDGGGGVFVLRTSTKRSDNGGRYPATGPCTARSSIARLDPAGTEVGSIELPALECQSAKFGAAEIPGATSLARAQNGDLWVGGITADPDNEDWNVAFAHRLPASLSGIGFTASTTMARDAGGIYAAIVDGTGALFTRSTLVRKIAMTSPDPAPAATGVAATGIVSANGDLAIEVSWQPAPGATGYDIQVWFWGWYENPIHATAPGQASTIRVPVSRSSKPPNGAWVLVRACANGFGEPNCGPASGATVSTFPGPVIVTPAPNSVLTGSTVTFSWLPGFGTFDGYRLTVQRRDGTRALSDIYGASQTTAFYSLPSGLFTAAVEGLRDGIGYGLGTADFSIRLPAPPAVTAPLQSAVVTGGNTVTVNFPLVPGADLYLVQAVQAGTGPGGGALTVAAKIFSNSPAVLRIPAGPAKVVVSACNGDGCAPHSDPVDVNAPGPNPTVPVIASPAAGAIVAGPVVFFSWSRIPGDNGTNTTYRLYVQDMGRQRPAAHVFTNQNYWAVRLQPGSRYDALVLVTVNGQESASAVANFVVTGQPFTVPTPVLPGYQETGVARRADGSIELGFAPVPGARQYQWILYPPSGPPIFDRYGGPFVQGLPPGTYRGKVRACVSPDSFTVCSLDSDPRWGPWSDEGGTGPWLFTLP